MKAMMDKRKVVRERHVSLSASHHTKMAPRGKRPLKKALTPRTKKSSKAAQVVTTVDSSDDSENDVDNGESFVLPSSSDESTQETTKSRFRLWSAC